MEESKQESEERSVEHETAKEAWTAQIDAAAVEKESLNNKKQELERRLETLTHDLETSKEQSEERCSTLMREKASVEEENSALQSKVDSINAALQEATNCDHIDKIEEINGQFHERNIQISQLLEEKKNTYQKFAEFKSIGAVVDDELGKVNNESVQRKSHSELLVEEKDKIMKQNRELNLEIEKVNAELEKSRVKIGDLTIQLSMNETNKIAHVTPTRRGNVGNNAISEEDLDFLERNEDDVQESLHDPNYFERTEDINKEEEDVSLGTSEDEGDLGDTVGKTGLVFTDCYDMIHYRDLQGLCKGTKIRGNQKKRTMIDDLRKHDCKRRRLSLKQGRAIEDGYRIPYRVLQTVCKRMGIDARQKRDQLINEIKDKLINERSSYDRRMTM